MLREASPEVSVSLAYIELTTLRVVSTTARYMVHRACNVTFERFVLRGYEQASQLIAEDAASESSENFK